MNKEKMQWWVRLILAILGMALVAVIFVPMWRIDLIAPQYPEGLMLLIYPDRLAGNVDIINGLNHYIGMKTLHTEDFPEFKILPYLIGFFALAFFVTGLIGKRKLLYFVFALFVCFGILAMYDFWRWEYDYGHHLDPNAAIIVPGMAYQPPLIGFKQLLNFGAYSMPDIGGWIFVAVGVITLFLVLLQMRITLKAKKVLRGMAVLVTLTCLSCNTSPESMKIGIDNCYFCKMTVSDKRFGAELVTVKGKIYKFDDLDCLKKFMKTGAVEKKKVKDIYFTNYCSDYGMIPQNQALLLKSVDLRSPMGGNVAAFNNKDSMAFVRERYPGETVQWSEL